MTPILIFFGACCDPAYANVPRPTDAISAAPVRFWLNSHINCRLFFMPSPPQNAYRRLSNLRMARLISRSVTTKQLVDEDSAGWTTYGTSRAAFSLFQGVATPHEGSSENPWERRHPCLLASVSRLLPEARRQGWAAFPGGFSEELSCRVATLRNEEDVWSSAFRRSVSMICDNRLEAELQTDLRQPPEGGTPNDLLRSRSCRERRPETMKFPWERRHPCLRASANSRLTEARRQGCLRSQGFSEEKYDGGTRLQIHRSHGRGES